MSQPQKLPSVPLDRTRPMRQGQIFSGPISVKYPLYTGLHQLDGPLTTDAANCLKKELSNSTKVSQKIRPCVVIEPSSSKGYCKVCLLATFDEQPYARLVRPIQLLVMPAESNVERRDGYRPLVVRPAEYWTQDKKSLHTWVILVPIKWRTDLLYEWTRKLPSTDTRYDIGNSGVADLDFQIDQCLQEFGSICMKEPKYKECAVFALKKHFKHLSKSQVSLLTTGSRSTYRSGMSTTPSQKSTAASVYTPRTSLYGPSGNQSLASLKTGQPLASPSSPAWRPNELPAAFNSSKHGRKPSQSGADSDRWRNKTGIVSGLNQSSKSVAPSETQPTPQSGSDSPRWRRETPAAPSSQQAPARPASPSSKLKFKLGFKGKGKQIDTRVKENAPPPASPPTTPSSPTTPKAFAASPSSSVASLARFLPKRRNTGASLHHKSSHTSLRPITVGA